MTTASQHPTGPPPWHLVIVIDGDPPVPGWKGLIAPSAVVIAADGGARHAGTEDVVITDLVGDFDSLTPREVDEVAATGARIHRYEVDKDFTDFELAARLAGDYSSDNVNGHAHGHANAQANAQAGVHGMSGEILVVGGAGGRLDHALGNLAVLGGPDLAAFAVTALLGDTVVRTVSPDHAIQLEGPVDRTVSLLPVGGAARGVATRGMRFELHHEDLLAGRTRGLSNVVAAPPVEVSVAGGTLLVIEPEATTHLITPSQGERS